MDWETASARAERAVDIVAAAAFSAAVGFAAWSLAADGAPMVAAASATGFLLVYRGLRRVPPEERGFELPGFAPPALEPVPGTDGEASAELLLDDRLGKVDEDARVVRLFGQVRCGSGQALEASDASEALSDALEELRRSLR